MNRSEQARKKYGKQDTRLFGNSLKVPCDSKLKKPCYLNFIEFQRTYVVPQKRVCSFKVLNEAQPERTSVICYSETIHEQSRLPAAMVCMRTDPPVAGSGGNRNRIRDKYLYRGKHLDIMFVMDGNIRDVRCSC